MMRHIDHLVVAVHDLDAAGAEYEALGLQVGAVNRHPWGTENRIIQFRRSFIELITVGAGADIPPHAPGRFSFGAFVRDYLEHREGLAMLVLGSTDAKADAAQFAADNIGAFDTFHFARSGRNADGAETRVAFTLAFAEDPLASDAGFFTCQQHFPEAFWNPRQQVHPNGATDITRVTFAAPDPDAHRPFLQAFTGTDRLVALEPGPRACLTGFTITAPAARTVSLRGTDITFEATP
ncbi:VOC family protein [Falsirhodobacter sp. 20TX0035]|uniref:VOC family protein n=1 Tax=Falsirhodobacter sp. 20TX0035 TaxID=3022019 RepID=UPI00232CA7C3|nr:VOC family protein [Falsirhodobacter sp. 20TX0035]MDB6453701.1 VOC family protein [Falsirhodobacter sp. 20TX0035]